jgi:hypothetical protein
VNKDTRNAIERVTQRARKLLEEDFASQLEGDFDVHRGGAVAAKPGAHLSARQTFQRERIVAAIEHKRATGMSASDAVADYRREAAFTTLNRFVALKMLEARELVQECITKGEQSGGYREFCGMAPGLPLLPNSAGYRLYIECVFDELSTEVKVLFDRRDPSSVLWPKRATLDQLREILNVTELADVWSQDETIGWTYQYFNGDSDRKAARYDENDQPKAPQNSRELAVRNQFFTPRYVVQFLTDNTLGRTWYEMRGTKTTLAERCEYMVQRPCEEFVSRVKKDPRDLRVLDPACGSGHFLLYAFDLLLAIYEEAYADPESPKCKTTGRTLVEDYPSIDALRRAVPGLILAHNLHGVDIDPRCAQIAQLALWMRAQKAYRDFGIGRGDRLQIRRSNIVVAEPLVADEQLVKDFVARHCDAELGRVFTTFVEALALAGDLGLLLRLERLVTRQVKHGQTGDLFLPPEERIRAAVSRFIAEDEGRTSTQRRLFADDTAQGIGLLAIAHEKFDVVLMNPPFGEPTGRSQNYINGQHSLPTDLYCSFVARGIELAPDGLVGAITSSSFLLYTDYEQYRHHLIHNGRPVWICDLGWGVLDAQVATAVYVIDCAHTSKATVFFDVSKTTQKQEALLECMSGVDASSNAYKHTLNEFDCLSGKPFAYWFSKRVLEWIAQSPKLESIWREHGIGAGPHNFFFRLRWELPLRSEEKVDRWPNLSNGGHFSPYFRDNYLHIDWRGNGRHIKAHLNRIYPYLKGNIGIKIQREHVYLQPGLTYGKRTERFNAQILPRGCIPSFNGIGAYPAHEEDVWWVLAYLNSRFVGYFLNITCGLHKNSVYIDRIPIPAFTREERGVLGQSARSLWRLAREANSVVETSASFVRPALMQSRAPSLMERMIDWRIADRQREVIGWECVGQIERIVLDRIDPPQAVLQALSADQGPAYWDSSVDRQSGKETGRAFVSRPVVCRDDAVGDTDLFCEVLSTGKTPAELVGYLNSAGFVRADEFQVRVQEFVSWLVGCVFGRWNPRASSQFDDMGVDPFAQERWLPQLVRAEEGASARSVAVLDEHHPEDLCALLLSAAASCAPELVHIEGDLHDGLGFDARYWLSHEFFNVHVAMYSKSRRKAPIYWQLATSSASYSVWLYIHAFSKDTLFLVQKDYVAPKLAHEERRLESLATELRDKATAAQRKQLAAQESIVEELRAFLEELRRVAPLWNPNLDDGVIINFAPLWRLVPHHKAWQKELKSTWDALCDGKHDWAYLAMHLWPERVVPKCATDRSIAIAHGLDDVFWVEGKGGKWTVRNVPARSVEELVRERTSPAVKAALKSVFEAPAVTGNGGRRRGGRRRSAAPAEPGEP